MSDDSRWYAVHTLPRNELRAEAQLTNQRFRTFLPRRLKTIRHARKLTTVVAPFFPRYLFVALDLMRHRWRSVNGTFGVATLVMQCDMPQPVPQGVVESLIASTDQNGLLCLEQRLRVGSSVRLTAGPFAEQLAILDRLDNSGRVRVLLNIMGGPVPVQIRREFVVPAA